MHFKPILHLRKSGCMSSAFRWILEIVATALFVEVLGAATHLHGEFQAEPPARWSMSPQFPEPEEELYGVPANGKMHVTGGYGIYGDPIGMLWEYDPATDAWKALALMPGKRGSPVAVEVGGLISVIGGAVPEPGAKEVAKRPSRAARSVGTNKAYDPVINKWSSRSPMLTQRNHTFAGAVNGKIYVIGGRLTSTFITVARNLDIVEEYDPGSNTRGGSGARTPMPTARIGGGWTTYNGKIYVAGGEIQTRRLVEAYRALEA
jgi:N-acetylneuraminic acid mutarotase